MSQFDITPRNKVIRVPEAAVYDRVAIYQIIDASLVCQVGFVQDGQPFVIPTMYVRDNDTLLVHGATTSRLIRHIATGEQVCINITILDGIVFAKSIFNHSLNYRSAVLFGRGSVIHGEQETLRALELFTEHLFPGRWAEVRPPNSQELKATAVGVIKIDSASAKVRSGPPDEEPGDRDLTAWAGVIPLALIAQAPTRSTETAADQPTPASLTELIRRFSA
jgi:hypothetical protein